MMYQLKLSEGFYKNKMDRFIQMSRFFESLSLFPGCNFPLRGSVKDSRLI